MTKYLHLIVSMLMFACRAPSLSKLAAIGGVATVASVTVSVGTQQFGCSPIVGGAASVGGRPSTGGSLATGGRPSTGGGMPTGGKVSTGGAVAIGGSSSLVVVFPQCNSTTEHALKAANHRKHKLGGKAVKPRGGVKASSSFVT